LWIVLVLVVLIGCAVLVNDFGALVRVFPGEAALAFVLMLLTAAVGWAVLRRVRPISAPPRPVSLVAVGWGVTAATGLAILANGGLQAVWARLGGIEFASEWSAALTAPLNEEVMKLCGVALIALAWPALVRGPMDGFVYGSLVGLGFQVAENWTYAMNGIVLFGATDDTVSVLQSFFARVALTGFGSHWAMSAVAGAGLGFLLGRAGPRVVPGLGLILLAMAMHWQFDSPLLGGLVGTILKALLNLAIALTVYFVLRHRVRATARAVAERAWPGSAAVLLGRRARRRALRTLPTGPERTAGARDQRRWVAMIEDAAYP
jgi:RsiW-degrading membrane proteinase PrsW (M82 family)